MRLRANLQKQIVETETAMQKTLDQTIQPEIVANHHAMIEKTLENATKLKETLETRKKAKLERFSRPTPSSTGTGTSDNTHTSEAVRSVRSILSEVMYEQNPPQPSGPQPPQLFGPRGVAPDWQPPLLSHRDPPGF